MFAGNCRRCISNELILGVFYSLIVYAPQGIQAVVYRKGVHRVLCSIVRDIEILFLSKVATLTSMGRTLYHADLLNFLSVRDGNPFPRPRQLPPWPRSSAILDEHALSSRYHVWVMYPLQICMHSQEEPGLCVFSEPLYNIGLWNGRNFKSIYKKSEKEAKKAAFSFHRRWCKVCTFDSHASYGIRKIAVHISLEDLSFLFLLQGRGLVREHHLFGIRPNF